MYFPPGVVWGSACVQF